MERLSLSTFPQHSNRAGGGQGGAKKMLLFFSLMWRELQVFVFSFVLLGLTWWVKDFPLMGAASLPTWFLRSEHTCA